MMGECYFNKFNKCSRPGDPELSAAKHERISSIINASKLRDDRLPTDLESAIQTDNNYSILCHRVCVSSYTSKEKINRHLKSKTRSLSEPPPAKRTRIKESETFSFQTHCIFCGEKCSEFRDPKNPSRWRQVSRCRTIDSGQSGKTLKEAILQRCNERNDKWAHDVELRVLGAVSDLHAVDARYHRDCKPAFMAPKAVEGISISKNPAIKDVAFQAVVSIMEEDRNKLWTSVEVHALYTDHGGDKLVRRILMEEISNYFGDQILFLSCKGLSTLLVFRSRASQLVKLVEETDVDSKSLKSIAQQVIHETREIVSDTSSYSTTINQDIARDQCSETLLSLLSQISPKLDGTLPALLIGNMITSTVKNTATTLQIALGIVARDKSIINTLHDFSVTSSYDEILRFKSSAASHTANINKTQGLFNAENGLIQAVIDNYDANISSLNGLKSTHAMALLMCQSCSHAVSDTNQGTDHHIPRLSKSDMTTKIQEPVQVHQYCGPRRPDMPPLPMVDDEEQNDLMQRQHISLSRAQDLDLQFFQSIVNSVNPTEYGGHITKVSREQNHTVKPATDTRYRPLIDLAPSDPSTVKTVMLQAQALTAASGQQFVVITADQQLYKVVLDNIWATPELFSNFYPRLGGLHTIMNFCGAVGKLMMDSGLGVILKHAFGGVEKMLSGKKYPQNVRAFRLLTEELLRKHLDGVETFDDLDQFLTDMSSRSNTSKLWVDCFIRPTLIMMTFTRAERESDWPLHLWALTQMIPYFFVASHVNYARYGLYYLTSMEALPPEVKCFFLQGQHTMRHAAGASNATWSDMYIETTFMRYGHSQGGLTGITLNDNATQRWALSLHTCSGLISDLAAMRNYNPQSSSHHKEETPGRIQADAADRSRLREKLTQCIDPLNPEGHPPDLFNIVSGKVAEPSVNVHDALHIGHACMESYKSKLPDGFYNPISSPVITMASARKQTKLGSGQTFDTNVIFSRTLGIMSSCDFDLENLFSHELSPIPTALFLDDGSMRPPSAKAKLKKCLEVEQSLRTVPNPDIVMLDGCAILWSVHWPVSGMMKDLVQVIAKYVTTRLTVSDVYLIFDRYYTYSTKGCTRGQRMKESIKEQHHFTLQSSLPSQQVSLTITENKVQIIDILCQNLILHFQNERFENRLVITGSDQIPDEVHNGVHIRRHDLAVNHEEADVIIINQAIPLSKEGSSIHVVCDDADVFALLVHFYDAEKLTGDIFMIPTNRSRAAVSIGATVQKHKNIAAHILSIHALTGCDTVSTIFGIGKVKALNTFNKGCMPPILGNVQEDMQSLCDDATHFIANCYGSKVHGSMSKVRFQMWKMKTGNSKAKSFRLASLPPTTEAFALHVQRAQFQACIWKAALNRDPPHLDPVEYGWKPHQPTQSLHPVLLPANTMPAPAQVMTLLCCSCSSEEACASRKCTCNKCEITCTVFCKCSSVPEITCCNPLNIITNSLSDSDDEDADNYDIADDGSD